MSRLVDSSAEYLHNALRKMRPGVADMVRFNETSIRCWRCGNPLEVYYCENGTYAVRCSCVACAGVFLVKASNPDAAAEAISGEGRPSND